MLKVSLYVLNCNGYVIISSRDWDVDESLQSGRISIETCWIVAKAVGNSTRILFHTHSMWQSVLIIYSTLLNTRCVKLEVYADFIVIVEYAVW